MSVTTIHTTARVHGPHGGEMEADVSVDVELDDLPEPFRSAEEMKAALERVVKTHDPAWGVGEQRDRMAAVAECQEVLAKVKGGKS